MKLLFLSSLALLLSLCGVQAKAAYYPADWMITNAEVIAVVEITTVTTNSVKGKHWTYSETASAKVEKVLKGRLPSEVRLQGGEDFICAQVKYQPGRRLVFLQRDGELLAGINWHLGNRAIINDKVEWFDDANLWKPVVLPLTTVLERIEAQLQKRD